MIEDTIRDFVNSHLPPPLPLSEEYEDNSEYSASVERDSGIYLKCPLGSELSLNRSSVLTVDEDLEGDSIPPHHREPYDLNESSHCPDLLPRNSTDNEELMEYAKKLGYSESQVKSAIKKLGIIVDQNDLLHELIKASNSIRDNKLIGEDSSLKKLYDTATNLSTNSADNGFLRHIVVDGSNVAMRYVSLFLNFY